MGTRDFAVLDGGSQVVEPSEFSKESCQFANGLLFIGKYHGALRGTTVTLPQ